MADSVALQAYKRGKELIERWDDSAAKEAYENAQRRYRGNCNDLPSNIPLSSPDAYISYINEVWSGFNSRKLLEQARDEEDYPKRYTNKYKNLENKESQVRFGGSKVDNKRRKYGDGFLQSLFRHSTSRGPRDHGQKHQWWRRNTGREYVRAYNGSSEN